MSSDELKQLESDLSAIKSIADMTPRMHSLMKLMVGMLVAASMAISSVAFWVKVTTDRLARAEASIITAEQKRDASMADWQLWRASKDANDIKLTVIVENQQRLLERMAYPAGKED